MKTISIIIPVYNTENYLGKTIESVLAQTYSDLEIILVDDGSTDSSGKLCDQYAQDDPRLKVIHQENQGLKCARLAGIQASNGRYICFSDSDDWVEQDYVQWLAVDAFEYGADITTGAYISDNEGQEINNFTMAPKQLLQPKDAMLTMFKQELFNWTMCNKLYKRELFDGVDAGPFPDESYGEDTYFNYKLFSKAQSVFYNGSFAYHYVVRKGSMMQQGFDKRMFIYVKQWTEIYDTAMKVGDTEIAEAVLKLLADTGITHVISGFKYYGRDDDDTLQALDAIKTRLKREPVEHGLYKQLVWYLRTPSQQMTFLAERTNLLEQNVTPESNIFLYGAGKIAFEVGIFLEESGIDYKVVVSEAKKNEIFRDRRVYSFEDVDIKKDDLIILGLSQRNKDQVTDKLADYNVLDFGKYSFYY